MEAKKVDNWLEHQLEVYKIVQDIKKVHEALKPRYFRMDELVHNKGLQHIPEQIFALLDFETVGQCRLVSKPWKKLIDEHKSWWALNCDKALNTRFFKLQDLSRPQNLLEFYPEFRQVCDHLVKHEPMTSYKLFVEFMIEFTLDEKQQKRTADIASPLHFAAMKNRLDIFELVAKTPMENLNLLKGYDEEDMSATPLGIASYQGHTEIVKFYLDLKGPRSIDINATEQTGYSPFQDACHAGHPEVVKLFFDYEIVKNLDINKLSSFGQSALKLACHFQTKQIKVVEMLLEHPGLTNINAQDAHDDTTALHYACNEEFRSWKWRVNEQFEDSDVAKIIELFLQHPDIDLNLVDHEGRTPLHLVCMNECALKFGIFLKFKQIDINARDQDGRTIVHLAFMSFTPHAHICWSSQGKCQFGRSEKFSITRFSPITALILKHSEELQIDFEVRDNDGRTPLHLMYMTRCYSQTQQFLDEAFRLFGIKFNTEALDNDGKTPRKLRELMKARDEEKRNQWNKLFETFEM